MNVPSLRRGDLIHLAIPACLTLLESEKVGDNMCAAYRRQGISVFAIDYVRGSHQVQVVSVIRGGRAE